jgi:hypothetical protein
MTKLVRKLVFSLEAKIDFNEAATIAATESGNI